MYNIEDPDPKAIDFLETNQRKVKGPAIGSLASAGWNPSNLPSRASDLKCRPQAAGQGEAFTQVVAMRKPGKKEELWILSLGMRALSCGKPWCLDHHLGIYEAARRGVSARFCSSSRLKLTEGRSFD